MHHNRETNTPGDYSSCAGGNYGRIRELPITVSYKDGATVISGLSFDNIKILEQDPSVNSGCDLIDEGDIALDQFQISGDTYEDAASFCLPDEHLGACTELVDVDIYETAGVNEYCLTFRVTFSWGAGQTMSTMTITRAQQ